MKKQINSQATSILMGFAWSLILFSGCSYQSDDVSQVIPDEPSATMVLYDLSDAEIASLMYMVEEEKMAMDVYTEMYKLYHLKIFGNIKESEFKHLKALSNLIDKYDLINPIISEPGKFVNEEIQQMYDAHISQGGISKIEAKEVGVAIEETEIEDLEFYLDNFIEAEDIRKVYTNLLIASNKHLEAFENELK